jgi:hypothetical protein
MLSKTKITKKKFYGKWLYKITLQVKGAGIFRSRVLEEITELCKTGKKEDYQSYTLLYKTLTNSEQISDLASFLKLYDQASWSKRIENNSIDFYTNEADFYNSMSIRYGDDLVHRFEPTQSSLDLLESTDHIIVSKLPHDRYNYKVFLQPHKMAFEHEDKIKFIEWIEKQKPRITCTSAVKQWFIKTDWNWDRRYVLVEDEQTLLMMKLRGPEVVGKIYNYVICDK